MCAPIALMMTAQIPQMMHFVLVDVVLGAWSWCGLSFCAELININKSNQAYCSGTRIKIKIITVSESMRNFRLAFERMKSKCGCRKCAILSLVYMMCYSSD